MKIQGRAQKRQRRKRLNRVQLITLGCSKNRVDSEHILSKIENAGMEVVVSDRFPVRDAKGNVVVMDAVALNTCGFINDAKEESVNAVLSAIEAKKSGYVRAVYVFGCLSQRYRKELMAEMPEVDGFFGVFDYDDMLKALGVSKSVEGSVERHLTTPGHYAYLKISEGCNRRCAYCSIPYIRGRHISVPMEQLLEEAGLLAARGVKELIVVAQDTTYYGLDLYGKRKIAELLELLSKVNGIEWIRLHYSYPAQFPEDLLKVMAENPKICKYLDIPLQHSSGKVLESMKREIDGIQTQNLIGRIRESVPGVVLRTTMIVGFPTEDNREFVKLLEFVRKNKFERLGAFTYSEEEGTYGAIHYRDSVRKSTKQKRFDALMELQAEISRSWNESRRGSEETVIIDSFSDGVFVARSQFESPEVDGEILIDESSLYKRFGRDVEPCDIIGTFAKVRITGSDEYDLTAEFI